MRDLFTLVIPTYNRSQCLGRLLRYLEANEAKFRIRILDSSRDPERCDNQRLVKARSLSCEYVEFDQTMHPFDKFRAGVAGVTTPFCCLCADDDVLLPDGLMASVRFLEANPDYAVAHGYYFQFMVDHAELRLSTITYYTPSYDEADPIARVHALMRHYQALTYGVYRTDVLQRVFATVTPVTSLLARELLSSALAAVEGRVARLPMLYHGRNLGPSSGHVNWHPLEWLIRDPKGLFGEYSSYRELLAGAIQGHPGESRSREEIERLLDLIHMQYLIRHAPDETFDFIVSESLAGKDADAIFSTHAVGVALWQAAEEYAPLGKLKRRPPSSSGRLPAIAYSAWPVRLARAVDRISPRFGFRLRETGRQLLNIKRPVSDNDMITTEPRNVRSPVREYRIAPAFINPPARFGVSIGENDIARLIATLDAYH
jgi:glycosyltransferase domain-containing protein